MASNLFSTKGASSSPQYWSTPFPLTASGQNLATLFNLYNSLGAVTIGSGSTAINTIQDGPIQVVRYGALTVNGTLTASNRCRGLCILCDSLTMGASGIITMSALGAAGSSKWLNQDIVIPTNMVLSGHNTTLAQFLAWIATTGYAIFDPTLFGCPMPGMGDVQANYASWPGDGTQIIAAAGCGTKVYSPTTLAGSYNANASASGNAGSKAPGGGGGGGGVAAGCPQYRPSAPGTPWGGGPGGAAYQDEPQGMDPDQYGGKGGEGTTAGAGNPAGDGTASGTGGVLLVFSRGAVSLATGHLLSANGMPGKNGVNPYPVGGGGSGGGKVGLYYAGALAGTPNMTATGGTGGTGSYCPGGSGGAGHTEAKTFSAMGY
jgi:hypothetical protein